MKIKWLGHSCFKLTTEKGTTVITDPYGEGVGYKLIEGLSSDIVTVSHRHDDHGNVAAIDKGYVLLNSTGLCKIGDIEINGFSTYHDDSNGSKRGSNIVFRYEADGMSICHMGDIGEEITDELVEALAPVNVLLMPVGGFYTVEPDVAKRIVDKIKPSVVIPMHYKTKKCVYNIEKIDKFLSLFNIDSIKNILSDEIDFNIDDFEYDKTKLFVLSANNF